MKSTQISPQNPDNRLLTNITYCTTSLANTVGFHSLEWDRQFIPAVSTCGNAYDRWMPVGMPKIPDKLLDVAFYLYNSVDSAQKGENYGGTGFIASLPFQTDPSKCTIYGVTNWHVAVRDGFSTIRLNNTDGTFDIRKHDPSEWLFDTKYDIAVIPLRPSPSLQLQQVLGDQFVTEDYDIGIGDDVFMVGRFVDHDGVATNRPALRFGNISIMPAPIEQPNGSFADSFCVDVHSRTGFSGSPVFVYNIDENQFYYERDDAPPKREIFLKLLGIHWGQFPELYEIKDGELKVITSATDDLDGKYIKGLSGMTCVLPAWAIMEVLNKKEIVQHRKNVEAELRARDSKPVAEVAQIPIAESDDTPSNKEDFDRLLKSAVTNPPTDD